MKEKLNQKTTAYSLAVLAGILYVVCAVLLALFPVGALNLFNYMFHGIDLTAIIKTTTFAGVIIGLIEIIISSLIIGWLFAKIYNYFSR